MRCMTLTTAGGDSNKHGYRCSAMEAGGRPPGNPQWIHVASKGVHLGRTCLPAARHPPESTALEPRAHLRL